MSLTKVSYSLINGASVNVLDFGADPTGATDSTTAIQNAVNSHNGFVSIYFPTGTYKITSTITFAYDRYFVYGDGVSSKINFVPTANDDCFLFDKGSTSTVQNVIRDLAFYSDDTTYDKRAITLVDVSQCLIDNVQTIYPHWSGGSNYSTFLFIQGRDSTSVRNLNVFADVPIRIAPIPAPHVAAGIGIDHFHFQDCYLACMKDTKWCVQIDSGVNLTHTTFDGYQAWVGGNYGLYWNDTTTVGTSIALTLKNIRWEQQSGTTGYFVYINHNYSLQQLILENLYGAGLTNGFYFNNVVRANLKEIFYIGNQVGLSTTSNCNYITFDSVFFNDPATTMSVNSSYGLSGSYWVGGNCVTLLPSSAPNAGNVQYINPEPTNKYSRLVPKKFTVADNATQILCDEFTTSTLIINTGSDSTSAIYQIRGANHSTALLCYADVAWWGTSVGSKYINVYWNGSNYVIQNVSGGPVSFYIVSVG